MSERNKSILNESEAIIKPLNTIRSKSTSKK